MVKTAAKKATMVKDVVGKVRTSTWDLPPSSHTYGALVAKDSEGAGAVLSTWDVSKPSVAKTSDRNLIKTNALAIHHGNITAKDVRLFAQAHPEIRFTPPGTNVMEGGMRKRDKIPFDGPYGTKSEKMACPLSALIEARFTDFAAEGKDYPDVSVLQKKFRMPPPRETKASEGHNVNLKPPRRAPSTFVMKKFQNVPGRVNPPNPG
ncbi:unnamed protein product, partial [Sphacelaria rigidula]